METDHGPLLAQSMLQLDGVRPVVFLANLQPHMTSQTLLRKPSLAAARNIFLADHNEMLHALLIHSDVKGDAGMCWLLIVHDVNPARWLACWLS